MGRIGIWLKLSRPGLWFPCIWLYLLPLDGLAAIESPSFWIGMLYIGFPLNFWVYGWNDMVDRETDRCNPRKDSYLFGARANDAQLDALPGAMAVVQLICWPLLIWSAGIEMLGIFLGIAGFLAVYNHPHRGLRSRPPWELCCQAGYLLVVLLSCTLNDAPLPRWEVWLYLSLFCVQSQLIGEVMDIGPDSQAGRQTTAVKLGITRTKGIIALVVLVECLMMLILFEDRVFGGGLCIFLVWLALDGLVLFRDKEYTVSQMKLFGVGGNISALGSIIYVQWSGVLS
jgi:4-hydroxybenzoate polyprenyltransferase